MIKYTELHQALTPFTHTDIHEQIPVSVYQRVIQACFRASNKGLNWDISQAASILIYLALNEDYIQPNQLNQNGLASLEWAKRFLNQVDTEAKKDAANALKTPSL